MMILGWLLAMGSTAWGLWTSSRAWRFEWRVARVEDQLAARSRELDEAERQRHGVEAELAARDRKVAFLEAELDAAMRRESAINGTLAARVAEIGRLQEELQDRRRHVARPMPEGVRLILEAIGEMLVVDGYDGLRFVHAAGCEERDLFEVELLEREPETWSTTFHRAGRMQLELQREAGSLALVLFDGAALRAGTSSKYPEEGHRIVLTEVDGPAWEGRLGFLLTATGEYPDPEAVARRRAPAVDRVTHAAWVERIDSLLLDSSTEIRWRLERFRNLGDARFGESLLLGFDAGGVLLRSAEADRLAIEVDREAGVVNLLLEGGILHQQAGDTRLPESGYRILLPGVTPAQANRTMLGLVVQPRR